MNNSLDDTSKIKTYVGEDGQIHFTDVTGADSVLPFNTNGISSYCAELPNDLFKSKYLSLLRVGLDIGTTISSAYKYSSSLIRLNMDKIKTIKINSVQACNTYATVYSVALLDNPATSYNEVYNNRLGTHTNMTTATNWFTINTNIIIDCTDITGFKHLCACSNSNNTSYKDTYVQIKSMEIIFV